MTGADQLEDRQGPGGPRPGTSSRQRFDHSDLKARIGALDTLATADLRIAWRELHRAEPLSRPSRDLLIRGVAYKLQDARSATGTHKLLNSNPEPAQARSKFLRHLANAG